MATQTINTGLNRVRSLLTPECVNLSKNIVKISTVALLCCALMLVFIGIAYAIQHIKTKSAETLSTEDKSKKERYAQIAASLSIVFMVVVSGFCTWNRYIAGKQVAHCLNNS